MPDRSGCSLISTPPHHRDVFLLTYTALQTILEALLFSAWLTVTYCYLLHCGADHSGGPAVQRAAEAARGHATCTGKCGGECDAPASTAQEHATNVAAVIFRLITERIGDTTTVKTSVTFSIPTMMQVRAFVDEVIELVDLTEIMLSLVRLFYSVQ